MLFIITLISLSVEPPHNEPLRGQEKVRYIETSSLKLKFRYNICRSFTSLYRNVFQWKFQGTNQIFRYIPYRGSRYVEVRNRGVPLYKVLVHDGKICVYARKIERKMILYLVLLPSSFQTTKNTFIIYRPSSKYDAHSTF